MRILCTCSNKHYFNNEKNIYIQTYKVYIFLLKAKKIKCKNP